MTDRYDGVREAWESWRDECAIEDWRLQRGAERARLEKAKQPKEGNKR